jgi:polyhydroxyalkanoate synthase
LAHLAAKRDARVAAATFIVTMLDSEPESQLGTFADESTIALAKQVSRLRGCIEGRDLARVFAWMRPNDLVWNYWVNNYLLGNDPPAFDILYWNNDTTRLPVRLHHELIDAFTTNAFRKPGAMRVLDTPVDMAAVANDVYVIAGITDHITPWKADYATTQIVGGRSEFVLSASGHIQAVLSPPGSRKAAFYTNPETPPDPDAWLTGATLTPGSWWPHWRDWITARAGDETDAPAALGNDRHAPGAPAPGTYVAE